MFAEAVLGVERGGVTAVWNLCPIPRRREGIAKGLTGLKELWVKEARQVPALGSRQYPSVLVAGPAELPL
jgi:hypothetical protein